MMDRIIINSTGKGFTEHKNPFPREWAFRFSKCLPLGGLKIVCATTRPPNTLNEAD